MKPVGQCKIITLFFIFFFSVFTTHSTGKKGIPLSHFRISDKNIREWIVAKDGYKEFKPEGLYDIIDGGADVYIEKGLQGGIFQNLKIDESGYQCEIFVEDYGSSKNAKEIFVTKTEGMSTSLKLNVGDHERIGIEEFIGGIAVYLYGGNYYFEILLSGFDSTEEAIKNVEPFILFFEKILSG